MIPIFPFTAIVGQEKMKLALVLNVINPLIGGVLIRGERGTGKSTAVRALAELLPEIDVIQGCFFNCSPNDSEGVCEECKIKLEKGLASIIKKKKRVVEIPLSATEDKVVGSLDIERAIKEGIKALDPGLLAAANRNILYVDEINLLSDHIVDDLLDSAAFGINKIEREGISIAHPAKFALVGSMNPEEGELRPQILDRLGLSIDIVSIDDKKLRLEILKRVEKFDSDPIGFIQAFAEREKELQNKIDLAINLIKGIIIPPKLQRLIVQICLNLQVPTHRGEITIARCAKALAAFDGRKEVNEKDVLTAAQLALGHRVDMTNMNQEDVEKKIADTFRKAKDQVDEESDEDSQQGEGEGQKKTLT
ncbi:MAG: magnesium chelatase [Candidatus Lokiarchaeota archaeon]|nr:magnesium chelatase [Candidatus Lokiarchaeota archaeon]